MKTLEIIFENDTKEVGCDAIELHDSILHVIVQGSVTQMWNMCKVVGVVLHDDNPAVISESKKDKVCEHCGSRDCFHMYPVKHLNQLDV